MGALVRPRGRPSEFDYYRPVEDGAIEPLALLGGNSNNIHLGSQGASSDDHTIRMGDVHTSTFIAGIRGITTQARATP